MKLKSKLVRMAVSWGASLVAAAIARKLLERVPRPVSRRVKEDLPIAKNLKTVKDKDGHYDIDGVSYDSTGVVVASDELTAAT